MAKYNIQSSNQLIDIATINGGCNMIDTAAKKFDECANIILRASNTCNDQALSVDKTTIQPQLEADAEYIRSMKQAIEDFTVQIRNVAVQIYSEQQTELANYEAEQKRKAEAAAAAAAANNSNTN